MGTKKETVKERLLSLDVFRGITMFLLVAEGTWLFSSFSKLELNGFLGAIIEQFHHHPWNGLRFWDLIQPFFMFIVGVSMPYSLMSRIKRGDSWNKAFRHIIQRCLILLALGIVLHSYYSGKVVWELWNVLCQLSFTILFAFLIMRYKWKIQLIISFALILLTDLLYRYAPIEGYDQAFVQGHNFGSWMDMMLMGKINTGGWVAINMVPTTAHTIWGVLVGKLFIQKMEHIKKIQILVIAGVIGIVIGYTMHFTGLAPIIKRICTSSFVIVSGGWSLLVLAFFYWFVDMKGFKKWSLIFTVFGMNSIFIYMFSQIAGGFFNEFIGIFTHGILEFIHIPSKINIIITALVVLGLETGLCYWMYKKKIFIKI